MTRISRPAPRVQPVGCGHRLTQRPECVEHHVAPFAELGVLLHQPCVPRAQLLVLLDQPLQHLNRRADRDRRSARLAAPGGLHPVPSYPAVTRSGPVQPAPKPSSTSSYAARSVLSSGAEPPSAVLRNRGAILDAAVDVLAVEPSASLAEIARRAGLGRATLYRHFASRDALRDAIREEALARAAAALQAAVVEGGTAREGMRHAVRALVSLGMRFRVLLAEGADTDPEFLEAQDRVLQPALGLIGRAVADGELDAEVSTAWIGMALSSPLATAVRAADAGVVDVEGAADLVCRTLFDGLGAP